ncbi:hypothetical protein RhiirA4_504539 [Rhizophagus irregularis]|uniref:Uncharacterized protein n=1 Tax=Rhizophagus irregularis TaxID=588596 RepID=A0A2I1H9J2_9GLOM|nr:hypothetical protein RhiirA4_504539 [Rhizophagus irregularis]
MSIPPESCDSLGFLQSPSWDDTTSTIDDSPYFIRTMRVDHAIEENFIIYEWNDEILQYSQRNLGIGKGQDIIYDLQRIESELANILVQNKVYFEVGNEQLVLEPFPYHLELFSSSMRILGDIKSKYKKALNEEMEEEIDNAIDYENGNKEKIPVDSFIIAMKRFIQRVLQIENDKENHRLYDYFTDMSLNLWNNNVIEEILDDKFPNTLLVANSFTAYEYIMQKKETFKPKQLYSSGMNTNSISIDTQMIAPSNATFTSPTQPTRTRNKGKKVIGKFDVM